MKYEEYNNIIHLQKIHFVDFKIIACSLVLAFLSAITLYSAANGNLQPWAIKQVLFYIFFLAVSIIVAITNLKVIYKMSYIIYFIGLILLAYVQIFGHTAMGATRWIDLKVIKLQPSELMKMGLILSLSRFFHSTRIENIFKLRNLMIPLAMIMAPTALILKQPDLGTATILAACGGSILFMAGVRIWKFVAVIVGILIAAPILWNHLHDYQKNRITSFISPESDPRGTGYNLIQSKIAIGSGGIFGKGYMNGTQGQLEFVPEKQTDFIFTMYSEEFGLIGDIFLLMIYAFIIASGIKVAIRSENHFGRLIAIGVTTLLFMHVCINTAMTMGLMPVVGVPLPLMSYGGSMTASAMIMLGIIMNVGLNYSYSFDKLTIDESKYKYTQNRKM